MLEVVFDCGETAEDANVGRTTTFRQKYYDDLKNVTFVGVWLADDRESFRFIVLRTSRCKIFFLTLSSA